MNRKIGLLFFLFLFSGIALTNVLAAPSFTGNVTPKATGTEYHSTGIYSFQVKINDTVPGSGQVWGIDNVTFETDFTGTNTNYTQTRNSTGHLKTYKIQNNTVGIYWTNFTMSTNISSAGNFTYKWYAINVSGVEGASASLGYEIAANTTVPVIMNITVYAIGGAQTNITEANANSYEGQGNPYADCWMGYSADGTGKTLWGTTGVYRDDASWTKGSTGATSLGARSYNVKCNSTGNTNYTYNGTGETFILTILASGSGGGGGGSIYDVTTTTPPFTISPPAEGENIADYLKANPIVVLVILGIAYFVFVKKK